jgi:cell filamentation protein
MNTACAACPRDAFAGRLACYLGEVNALHPFREGNGRAQRGFTEQLARDAGSRPPGSDLLQ